MNSLVDLYHQIGKDLENKTEIISKRYEVQFEDIYDSNDSGIEFFFEMSEQNKDFAERDDIEQRYHSYLINGLISHFEELKYSFDINIFDSRKIVFTNFICISFIQILIRDKIYVDVHMRSSAYDSALPTDLKFMSRIALDFILEAKKFNEVTEEKYKELSNKEVQLSITFGSLHKVKG